MQRESEFERFQRSVQWRRGATRALLAVTLLLCATATLSDGQVTHMAALAATLLVGVTLTNVIILGRNSTREIGRQRAQREATERTGRQIEELFSMTDMLQAAETHEDAGGVLMATSLRLLPDYGGALYVFNNSRDRLDLATAWNPGESFTPSDTLLPSNCWALKRGKPHINDARKQTLCCMHAIGQASTLEVPMMARGQVYGLLVLALDAEDGYARLKEDRRVARALADSMSLALSNIALREKLRTQSLRDPLTGLYNRRYMEDALERYISLAERTGSATSVLMIDLDNFKRLNDEHGHAKGDAVLRDVANQLVGALRPSDVVSRYGGEELMVILPNCNLEDAALKAEALRLRVEGLSDIHGTPISASFGIANLPQTATSLAELVPMADAALYAAKHQGKNRIATAELRASSANPKDAPRLAATG